MITVCRSIIKYKPKNPSSFLKPRVTPSTAPCRFIPSSLLSPKIGARVWQLLFNRYTFSAILIYFGYKKMAKTKNATPASRSSKRKAKGTPSATTTPVAIDSGDEISEMGSQAKRIKLDAGIRMEFVDRFEAKNIGNRTIILGKPVRGAFIKDSGVLELFEQIGMSSFFTELPKFCYPGLVRMFYGNLHVTDKGFYVSYVKGVKINLSSIMLGSMLGISIQNVSVYSQRGAVTFDDFSDIEQVRTVTGSPDVGEFFLPTTSKVLPLAHLLFRICIANICPRLGTKSNFSCQDLTVVAMILAGRKFDLSDLVLHNMMEVVNGSPSAGLPYGLLLSRIFEFSGVDTANEEQVVAKDFLDAKFFQQSGLVLKDGSLIQAEVVTPATPKTEGAPTKKLTEEEQLAFMDEVRAFLVKMEEDSIKFRKIVEKGFADMAARKAPEVEYDKVAAMVQKMLEDADLSDGDAGKAKGTPTLKPGTSSVVTSKDAEDVGGA